MSQNTLHAHHEAIKSQADKEFAKHVLTSEGEGRWLCATPGTRLCAFRVILAPCFVIVVGDVGDNILQVSDKDPLPWLRSFAKANRSYVNSYMVEKIRSEKKGEFYADDALAALRADLKDAVESGSGNEYADDLKSFIENVEDLDNIHDWEAAYHESNIDSETALSRGFGPNTASLWTVECLCWFARTLVAQENAQALVAQENAQAPVSISA